LTDFALNGEEVTSDTNTTNNNNNENSSGNNSSPVEIPRRTIIIESASILQISLIVLLAIIALII